MKKAIYKITNKKNNKVYIGQSNNPEHRWVSHKSRALNEEDKGKSAIHDALRVVGIENFTFEIIGWFENYNEKEKEYIKLYNSQVPNGYNLTEGGEEPPHKYGEEHHNSACSNETRQAIIQDLLSRKYTQTQIANKHKVKPGVVQNINKGVVYRQEKLSYPLMKTTPYHLTEQEVEEITFLLGNSVCTCAEIGAYYGCNSSSIKAINSGRNHYRENIKYPIRNFRGKANTQSVETILANRSTEPIDTVLEM